MASRYWVGLTNTWNGTAGSKWSTTSGGPAGAAAPTSSDDVFFDANSGTVTVTISSANARSINCTGFTGTLTGSGTLNLFGSITLGSAMTMSFSGNFFILASSTITCNGNSFAGVITPVSDGSTFTLADNFSSTSNIDFAAGTFDFNNKNAVLGNFGIGSAEAGSARVVSLGSGTVTVTGTNFGYIGDDTTYSATTGTIKFTNTSSSTVTFNPRDSNVHAATFNNIWFARGASTGTNCINTVGVAFPIPDYTIGPTFNDVKDTGTAAHALQTPDDNTVYLTTLTVNGSSGNLISLGAQTPGNTHSSLSKSSGTVVCDFLALTDSQATGGATWIATNSTNGGDNTGWVFGNPPDAILNGAGSLAAATTMSLTGGSVFTGAGTLQANASVFKFGTAVFAGTSVLSATARLAQVSVATFVGTGSLSALGTLRMMASATFAGSGSLIAVPLLSKDILFQGSGSLSATMTAILAAMATMPGAGSFSATLRMNMLAQAQYAGAGALAASVLSGLAARATFSGTGSFQAMARLALLGRTQFAGAGTLDASTAVFFNSPAQFDGAGSMLAMTFLFINNQARFAGAGHFCINATVRVGAFGATTNLAVSGPGATNNVVV